MRMHFEEGMTVTCTCEDWYATFGRTMRMVLGTKLTVTKVYRFNSVQMLEFEEYPQNGFIAHGFKPYVN